MAAHAKGHDHEGEEGHAGHDHAHEEDRRIRVLHGASPFCSWSVAYEGVLNRLKLLYGEQIKVNVYQIPVYDTWQEWLENYGMTMPEAIEWFEEVASTTGLPFDKAYWQDPPKSCVPGTLFVHAAEIAKPGAGERLARQIAFGMTFEGQKWNDEADLYKAAEAAGAPRKAVEAAMHDGRAAEALKLDRQDMHSLGVNFYALQIRDEGRTVILEHAFDPTKAEEAIDWLSRSSLRKDALPSLEDYATAHAPVSSRELQQVFLADAPKVRAGLAAAEKSGKLVRKTLLGMDCWRSPK
jgi:predicted DsbA family dithiol-disulfide isomerase